MGLFDAIGDFLGKKAAQWEFESYDREAQKELEKAKDKFIHFMRNANDWAEWGNKAALWVVMRRYMYGNSRLREQNIVDNDFPVDYEKAIKYGEIAIDKGIHNFDEVEIGDTTYTPNESVESMIAWCYLQLKNYDKAEFWYEKAYEQGYKGALSDTGELYMNRDDGKKDYEKALKYFEKSIKNDAYTTYCKFMIGRIHYESDGSLADKTKGLEMIRAAAKEDLKIAHKYMNENSITMGGGMLDD